MADDWQPVDDWQPIDKQLTWGDVPGQALKNAPSSGYKLVTDIAHTLNPMNAPETAGGMHRLFSGLGAKFGYGDKANEPYADAIGQYLKDRAGSVEAIKKTMAEDPVGFAADLSTVLTGGAGTARLLGSTGRITGAVGKLGTMVDPIGVPLRAAEITTKQVAPAILGSMSGVGIAPIKTAAEAGMAGGSKSADFVANMRDNVPAERVVDEARAAVGNMAAKRSAEYTAGMKDIKADATPLSFYDIEKSLKDTGDVSKFLSRDILPQTAATREKIATALKEWQDLASKDSRYSTPAAFDALKREIGGIKDSLPYGSPERKVASDTYNATRKTISDQSPEYSRVMGSYEKASDQIEDITKGLSLGQKASTDTALRKLQSVMRNNVNTNFGFRTKMAEELRDAGAPNLMEKLAGQSMSSNIPRGMARHGASTGGMVALVTALATGSPAPLLALGLAPATIPRVIGEAAHALGGAGRYAPSVNQTRAALIAALNEGRLPKE